MTIQVGPGISVGSGISFTGGGAPPPPTSNIPVTDGLVMQLDATNPLSYSGTGTTVTDLSGTFNHTLTNQDMFVDSGGIKYFQFDTNTTNKKMLVDGTGPLLETNGYTYMVWAFRPSAATGLKFLMEGTGGVPTFTSNLTGQYAVWDNSFASNTISANLQLDAWRQLTYTINSSNLVTLYINGNIGGTVTPSQSMRGRNHVGFCNIWTGWGRVAICCLYNRVLTAGEVTTNFNGLKSYFGI